MVTVQMAKLLSKTNHFNANQKVWLQQNAGDNRWKVVGKHRGKGRYVEAWVDGDGLSLVDVEVEEKFAERHNLPSKPLTR